MKYASNGKANAGLTLGIIGTALGGINTLAEHWMSGRHDRARALVEAKGFDWAAVIPLLTAAFGAMATSGKSGDACSAKDAIIAKLESEKYTDAAVLDLYKQQTNAEKEMQASINGNFREVYQALAAQDKQSAVSEAVLAERQTCAKEKIDGLTARVGELERRSYAQGTEIVVLGKDIQCLGEETRQEFRATRDWVKAQNYVPGTVRLRPEDMCPRPLTYGDLDGVSQTSGKASKAAA